MRGLLILAVVLGLGAMAWWAFDPAADETPTQAKSPPAGKSDEAQGENAGAAPRSVAIPPQPDTRAGGPTQTPKATAQPVAPPAPQGPPPNLFATVFDRSSEEPVAAVRYVLSQNERVLSDASIQGNEVRLALALHEPFMLRIESRGFEPTVERVRVDGPAQRLRVLLLPKMRGTGIELYVTSPDQTPAARVRVAVRHRPLNAPASAPLSPLWTRQAENDEGRYALPDLAPGRYRFTVQAVTATGRLMTHQPAVHELDFHGSEGVRVPLRLAAGALLQLDVRDPTGARLGQAVAVQLVHPDGATPDLALLTYVAAKTDPNQVEWTVFERVGGIPAKGLTVVAAPLPPGTYRLRLQRGAGAVVERTLNLQPNTEPTVKVTLH